MISQNRWLLPEGIEELLPEQATRLEQMRRELLDLYSSWGYELILPPFIEYRTPSLISNHTHFRITSVWLKPNPYSYR